tara:strand:- start:1373 stop:1636 length:264 start_codon:yes stop_codon:yes gene_type:complete
MIFFSLHNITDATVAIEVAESLVCDAIEARNSVRGKAKKVRMCMSKIKQLNELCHAKQWSEPLDIMKVSFKQLEDANAELDVNLWSL